MTEGERSNGLPDPGQERRIAPSERETTIAPGSVRAWLASIQRS